MSLQWELVYAGLEEPGVCPENVVFLQMREKGILCTHNSSVKAHKLAENIGFILLADV